MQRYIENLSLWHRLNSIEKINLFRTAEPFSLLIDVYIVVVPWNNVTINVVQGVQANVSAIDVAWFSAQTQQSAVFHFPFQNRFESTQMANGNTYVHVLDKL